MAYATYAQGVIVRSERYVRIWSQLVRVWFHYILLALKLAVADAEASFWQYQKIIRKNIKAYFLTKIVVAADFLNDFWNILTKTYLAQKVFLAVLVKLYPSSITNK